MTCRTYAEREGWRIDDGHTCEATQDGHRCTMQPQGYCHLKVVDGQPFIQHFCACEGDDHVRWMEPARVVQASSFTEETAA